MLSTWLLLNKMQRRLIKLIPDRVAQLEISEPVYALRVYYYGNDSDNTCTPSLLLPYVKTRKRLIDENPDDFSHYIWFADEHDCNDDGVFAYLEDEELNQWYDQWHAHLCDSRKYRRTLHRFRKMIQRVCRKLNRMDWSHIPMAAKHFVIFPADGAHEFQNDFGEMLASLKKDQIQALVDQGLLDPSLICFKMRVLYKIGDYLG